MSPFVLVVTIYLGIVPAINHESDFESFDDCRAAGESLAQYFPTHGYDRVTWKCEYIPPKD